MVKKEETLEETKTRLHASTRPGRLKRSLLRIEKELKKHDWSFQHSNDHLTWEAGKTHWEVIRELCVECEENFAEDAIRGIKRLWRKIAPKEEQGTIPVPSNQKKKLDKVSKKEKPVEPEMTYARRRELGLMETLDKNDPGSLPNLLSYAAWQHWNHHRTDGKPVSLQKKIAKLDELVRDPKWLKREGIEPYWVMVDCKKKRNKKWDVKRVDTNIIAMAKRSLKDALAQAPTQDRLTYLVEEVYKGNVRMEDVLEECGQTIHRYVGQKVAFLKDRARYEATQKQYEQDEQESSDEVSKKHKELKMSKTKNAKSESSKKSNPSKNGEAKHSNGDRAKVKIFGHPATAVLRWMGKEGWKTHQARHVLDQIGGEGIADNTISCQVGGWEYRGTPAELQDSEVKKLNKLVKGAPDKPERQVKEKKTKTKNQPRAAEVPTEVVVVFDSAKEEGKRVKKTFSNAKEANKFFKKMLGEERHPRIRE